MDLGVGEMGFKFCGKHPLLMTRTQVSNPGLMGPLILVRSNFVSTISLYRKSASLIDTHILWGTLYHKVS